MRQSGPENAWVADYESRSGLRFVLFTQTGKIADSISTAGLQKLFNPNIAGRPDPMVGRTELTLCEGMYGLLENGLTNVKNASVDIVAGWVGRTSYSRKIGLFGPERAFPDR